MPVGQAAGRGDRPAVAGLTAASADAKAPVSRRFGRFCVCSREKVRPRTPSRRRRPGRRRTPATTAPDTPGPARRATGVRLVASVRPSCIARSFGSRRYSSTQNNRSPRAATPPSGETSCGATHLKRPISADAYGLGRLVPMLQPADSPRSPHAVRPALRRRRCRRDAAGCPPRTPRAAGPQARVHQWPAGARDPWPGRRCGRVRGRRIQSPVNTTVSQSTVVRSPLSRFSTTADAHPVLAVDADQPAAGEHRPVHQKPAGTRNAV